MNLSRLLFPAVLLSLCCSCAIRPSVPESLVLEAVPRGAVVVDGVLNEPVWKSARVCALTRPVQHISSSVPALVRAKFLREKPEPGLARMVWDGEYVYIAAELRDADVVQYAGRDQVGLHARGDVFEVFLKPGDSESYWEFHIAPNGRKSGFFYRKRGYPNVVATKLEPDFRNAVSVKGTLNDFRDTDANWSLEAAIPVSALEKTGVKFSSGVPWRILFARCNYGYHLPRMQLSSFPKMPTSAFHYHEFYMPIQITNPRKETIP